MRGNRRRLAAGTFAALTFCVTPAFAYRTAADTPEFASTPKVRWATDIISYSFYDQVPSSLSLSDVQALAVDALQAWTKPACSRVVFAFPTTTALPAGPNDGRNTIQWISSGWRERGYDPSAAGITDTQYEKNDKGEWAIVEADVYLNAENHAWILRGAADGYRDAESVLVHEAGHMLGLLHPCEPGGAYGAPDCSMHPEAADVTMYPIYNPDQATLSADDVAGVCFLYPGSDCEITGCPAGTVCMAEGCLVQCGNAICAPDEQCMEDTCRRPMPPGECSGATAAVPRGPLHRERS